MKIAILSTSDSIGGAAIVTASLADALSRRGHVVEFITLRGKRERKPSFLAERLGILLRNGLRRDSLFKVSIADFGERGVLRQVRNFLPDVILLGWINQGFLSLKQIERISKIAPTFWVMHDMWNFTGICHYSFGCQRFTGCCGDCPMVGQSVRGEHDLSYIGWCRKRKFYRRASLRFVGVSSWVKENAGRSSLLGEKEVTVIPNVYPIYEFYIGKKEPGLIAWGAERLDNPIKGLNLAVEALNRLPGELGVKVVFFGGYKDVSVLKDLKVPYELAGPLDSLQVRELLSRAQVVLSTALYETFGNTLIEGQASGAVPVSFNRGGQVDIIDHLQSGYLAEFGDVESIARGIEWALTSAPSPEQLRRAAIDKFGAEAIAAKYEDLFLSGFNKKNS